MRRDVRHFNSETIRHNLGNNSAPENKENGLADQKREMNSLIAEAKRESAKWYAR